MRPRADRGFTLLEMLVALAVLSLAVLALLRLAGENARTEAVVEARALALVVAENRAIDALTSLLPPALGQTAGAEEQGSRLWRWTRSVRATDDPDILRVDIAVAPRDSEQTIGALTIFRSRR
jgi:general secretion pathway protein I